jgi:hypothetical protein
MVVPIINSKLLHYDEEAIKAGQIHLNIDGGKTFKLTAAYMLGAEAALKGDRFDSCTYEMISSLLMEWRQGWENQALHMTNMIEKEDPNLDMNPPHTPPFWDHEGW